MRPAGFHHSQKTRTRISRALTGKKRAPFSQEWKRHLAESRQKRVAVKPEVRKKISRSLIGEKHPNWKGGITPLSTAIRNCARYEDWKRDVLERDHYLCQRCFSWEEPEAHHKRKLSKMLVDFHITSLEEALDCEELWRTDHGVTLCHGCHNKTKREREGGDECHT